MGDGPLEERAERAAAGDSAALSRLVEEVQHPIHRLALRFLGHPEAQCRAPARRRSCRASSDTCARTSGVQETQETARHPYLSSYS
jgi:hypothetical protein